MSTLLDEFPPDGLSLLSLLSGAFDAHLHPQASLQGLLSPTDRLSASAGGVLSCWLVFAVAGFGYYKTTEDPPFTAAGLTHPVLSATHLTIQILAILGSVAVLTGALPLAGSALAHTRREPRLLRLLILPFLAACVLLAATTVLVLFAHSRHGQPATTLSRGAFVAWILTAVACGGVCVLAARRAVFLIPATVGRLRSAGVMGAIASAMMVAMTAAVIIYTIALAVDASTLAASANGPLAATNTIESLCEQLVLMVPAAVCGLIASRRGLAASKHLPAQSATTR
jgi:hypothetical protein